MSSITKPRAQHTNKEENMNPRPVYERDYDRQGKKLQNKVALITGGDSGIGRAVAVHFAREGADIAIIYYKEEDDAQITRQLVEEKGKKAILIQADIKDESDCRSAVEQVLKELGHIDIIVNNAGTQHPQDSIEKITDQQLEAYKANHSTLYELVLQFRNSVSAQQVRAANLPLWFKAYTGREATSQEIEHGHSHEDGVHDGQPSGHHSN